MNNGGPTAAIFGIMSRQEATVGSTMHAVFGMRTQAPQLKAAADNRHALASRSWVANNDEDRIDFAGLRRESVGE